MRIAILTALAEEPGAPNTKRAFRMLGGRAVLSHQVDFAIDCGVEAVLCLVAGLNAQVVASQHRAEDAGIRFQAVESVRNLLNLIKPSDQILVVQDGLIPSGVELPSALDAPSVLTFPADPGVTAGFERIDSETAWAGLLVVEGATTTHLAELPPDCDVASSLLRLALQAGTSTHRLDFDAMSARDWFVRSDASQRSIDKDWIASTATLVPFATPGKAVAQRMGMRLARDIVGTRYAHAPLIAGIALGVGAVAMGWMGSRSVGLMLATLSALALYAQQTVANVAAGRRSTSGKRRLEPVPGVFLDIVLGGALVLGSDTRQMWNAWTLAFMLILVRRLAAAGGMPVWLQGLTDRIVLSALMVAGTLLSVPFVTVAAITLAMLAALIATQRPRDDLTHG